MKKIAIAFIALLAAFAANAQSDTVRWIQTTHDFGAFSEDLHVVTANFRMVNDTSEPVSIIQASSTCGCTIPQYSQEPIAPGDTATLVVQFNAVGRPGKFVKYIYVRVSGQPGRTKLAIKGTVIGAASSLNSRYPVEMGPLRLRTGAVMMGRVTKGSVKDVMVEAYNQGTDTLRPQLAGLPPYLEASFSPAAIPPGELGVINAYMRSDLLDDWGIVSDSVQVIPRPDCMAFSLPVVAIIEEDFSGLTAEQRRDAPVLKAESERADLGKVGTEPVTAKLRITNRGKDPLLIRKVYSHDAGVHAHMSATRIKGGKSADLIVTYDPAQADADVVNSRITIISNDPMNPTTVVRVVGTR